METTEARQLLQYNSYDIVNSINYLLILLSIINIYLNAFLVTEVSAQTMNSQVNLNQLHTTQTVVTQ